MDASVVHNLATLEHQRRRRWSAVRDSSPPNGSTRGWRRVASNVGVVLTGVLRRAAWLVLIVTIAVVATYNMRDDGTTVIPRIVAGVGRCCCGDVDPGDAQCARPDADNRCAATANSRSEDPADARRRGVGCADRRRRPLTVPGVAAGFLLLSVPWSRSLARLPVSGCGEFGRLTSHAEAAG